MSAPSGLLFVDDEPDNVRILVEILTDALHEEVRVVASVEEVIDYEREESEEPEGPMEPRPPVVTVTGKVFGWTRNSVRASGTSTSTSCDTYWLQPKVCST